ARRFAREEVSGVAGSGRKSEPPEGPGTRTRSGAPILGALPRSNAPALDIPVVLGSFESSLPAPPAAPLSIGSAMSSHSSRAPLNGECASRTGVEAFLPGGEWCDARGRVFVHERLRSDVEKPKAHWGRLGVPPETEPDLQALAAAGLGRAMFLDLETGGLAT